MTPRLVLHEYSASGNCYKVRLTAALVGKTLYRQEYDIMKAQTRTSDFLHKINANGRIPVLQVDDQFLPESNAACYFVAENSHLIPRDPFQHADMLRWMFWEQYNHEPNIATLRFWMGTLGLANLTELQRLQLAPKRHDGNAALKLMDDHLSARKWFVGNAISLSDVCLFAYTHVAGDAEFDLAQYRHVGAWISRITSEHGFVPMDF